MSTPYTPTSNYHITDNERENAEQNLAGKKLKLNPWVVQQIILEILKNHWTTNDPAELGYTFEQRYHEEREKSTVNIDIGYNFKAEVASKRPAIFLNRSDVTFHYPTLKGGTIGGNVKESLDMHAALCQMNLSLAVIAYPVGLAEMIADYCKYPFLYFNQEIQRDFCLKQLRLKEITGPKILVEGKDNFIIELELETHFTDKWVIAGDHLKLNTVSFTIFDKLTKKPFENQ